MTTETRVNIGPIARQINSDGTLNSASYADFASMKPEFEALTAVLVDKVVTIAHDERDTNLQASLVLNFGREDTFRTLEKVMTQDIGGAAYRLDRLIEIGSVSPDFQATYDRFSVLLKARSELDPEVPNHPTLISALYGGIQTATLTMSESLRLIHDLGKGKTPQELVEIARRSYPLIVNLAAMHLEHFTFAGTVLQPEEERDVEEGFNHLSISKFTLSGEPGNERLEITSEALADINKLIEEAGPQETPTTGCPALVNFGEGSAIRKLWDWHLELAERIYPALEKPEVKQDILPDPTWGAI